MSNNNQTISFDDFEKEYCRNCGTQRCGGISDEEMRDGCVWYRQKVLGQPNMDDMIKIISKQKHPAT